MLPFKNIPYFSHLLYYTTNFLLCQAPNRKIFFLLLVPLSSFPSGYNPRSGALFMSTHSSLATLTAPAFLLCRRFAPFYVVRNATPLPQARLTISHSPIFLPFTGKNPKSKTSIFSSKSGGKRVSGREHLCRPICPDPPPEM